MQLEEVLRAMNALPPELRAQLEAEAIEATSGMRWVPNPGPQSFGYYCEADELFYGGEAGGGKTDLAVGLALEAHQRSLILREFKDDARAMGDRLLEILGTTDGWNGQLLRYKSTHKLIEFDGLPNEKDKQRHKGQPHDLIVFDEIGDFYESQYDFIVGWNRSTDPQQRCRVLATGNPPTRAKGLWVIRRWGAWLDPKHPNPAKPGELRWFIRNEQGEEIEVDGPGPHQVGDLMVRARSRTFIRAQLKDNLDLARTNYESRLAGLPKELRDAYMLGKFDASLKDHPFQVIPTSWIMDAQKRWTERPPPGIPQCGLGVDPAGGAGGGGDRFTIVQRYDWWFGAPICIPAKEIVRASQGAGHVVTARKDNADICIDMGGGYGSGTWERLEENGIKPIAYKGAHACTWRTKDGKLGLTNMRSGLYWKFRESLDPDQDGGSPIALPPDPELLSDLTVLTWEPTARGIQVLPKEKVTDLLGRSPDKGDATVLAHHAGPRGLMPLAGSGQYGPEQYIPAANSRRKHLPKVDLGARRQRYVTRR